MPAAPDLPTTQETTVQGDRPVIAAAWMVVTGLMFVGVTATVKHLGDRIPAAESAFLRYALGLVFLIPMWPQLRAARLTSRALKLFTLRGLAHAGGVILWFYGMTQITIAEVTAMNYMTPVYVTLGAALFLGERLAVRRILAVLAAMAGALLILRPGVRELSTGHLAMVLCAISLAGSYLLAKRLSGMATPAVIVGSLSVTVTVILAPVAMAVWVPPTLEELAWLMLVAAFATAGHYTMTLAFQAGPLAVTQPVTFLQLVWAVSVGALFFGEPVDGWVVAGGLLIMAAVSYIALREAHLKRAAQKS
ncbi:MAG: DMT family transporter [Pseudomonadota bacterium]